MPHLLSLPNELISTIANELDTRKKFRGTCRRINTVVSPRLFSSIIIDIDGGLIDAGISQLEALATKSTCAAEYVRTVYIYCLAPHDYDLHTRLIPTFVGGRLIKKPVKKLNHPKIDWVQGKIRELLPEALSMLKGATTVIWAMYSTNPDWASALISASLETLPALGALHLTEAPGHPELWPAHLNRIPNLTKLTVRGGPDGAVAEIIANSPHLTRLNLLVPGHRHGVGDHAGTLHSFLGKIPQGRPLHLEHLAITGYCVRFDDKTLPHLRYLRSLELKYIPYIPDDERQYYTEDLLSKSDRFGSSSEHLWGAVRREGIPIEMVIAPADDAVIDYLALATCIKKIGLLEADTDILAEKFFTQVVPRHSKTLVSLSVETEFEGPWCFGKRNVDIFLECTQLFELSIAVNTSSTNEEEDDSTDNPVGQIMAMAAQMPNLCRLELFPAIQEILRDTQDKNLVDEHFWSVCDELCDSITSFGPIDPAIHPNLIAVDNVDQSKFQPKRKANGVIKYVNVEYYPPLVL